jgi:ABC-type sulfate/molybdate transport systems ATPase subunit
VMEQQMRSVLSDYEGTTLFVTHNLEEAYRICDHLLVLEQGQVVAHGRKQEIFEQPPTVSVAKLTGCKNFSRAMTSEDTNTKEIMALDWSCSLQVTTSYLNPTHVGIRAHQLKFFFDLKSTESEPNTFPCWLSTTSETPHRMTLYIKLHQPPEHPEDYHLQAEVFKERWLEIKEHPMPWLVQLDPSRIMLFAGD